MNEAAIFCLTITLIASCNTMYVNALYVFPPRYQAGIGQDQQLIDRIAFIGVHLREQVQSELFRVIFSATALNIVVLFCLGHKKEGFI